MVDSEGSVKDNVVFFDVYFSCVLVWFGFGSTTLQCRDSV